ncbi:MAG TPA: BamA/TamA family outer membrane protein, partial [Acidobacteriota bacterium]|nr:BamA/TamA family outer membrane protein [Acidobacteriota bacterium]
SIGPRQPAGCDASGNNCTTTDVVGGDKAAVLNVELLFPVYEQYGLRGVAFFDVGNSFNSFSYGDLRRSVGFGGRWMSPFGPLRVELGFPISKQPHDQTSVIGFSVGAQ